LEEIGINYLTYDRTLYKGRIKMNYEKKIKSQRIIVAIIFILLSCVSFNVALRGTYTLIAIIVGFAFQGMAFFLLFKLKKD